MASVVITMDRKSIEMYLRAPAFCGELCGIMGIDEFRCTTDLKDGDCFVFNTDSVTGEHWLCMLYSKGVCYLFDSSLLTPPDS